MKNKSGKKPPSYIEPGHDRNATDQGHQHSHANELGPDTTIESWEGTIEIDTYEGANRSTPGSSDIGKISHEGKEVEEEID